MRDQPVSRRDGDAHAMFLPGRGTPVALLIAVLDVVVDERRLVEALDGVADGIDIPHAATKLENPLAKARPQSLAAAPEELQCDLGDPTHLPNTSISM